MSFESASANVAIRVRDLGKRYEIYKRPHQRLLQTLTRGRLKYFREFWALRHVGFDVERGESVGIVGSNGAGKSTLLHLIAGTLSPTEGAVTVNGRVCALLELGSGFNPEFSGRDNVFINAAMLGITKQEMTRRFDEVLDFSGIGDFIDQPINTYSSGMAVRLAFAVAVHSAPDVLIVDEVLSVGDAAFQSRCLERIRRMQAEGVSMLLVSHASNVVSEFCSRALYVRGGELKMQGTCREVLEQYADDVVSDEGGMPLRFNRGSVLNTASTQPASVSATQIMSVDIRGTRDGSAGPFQVDEQVEIVVAVRFAVDNPRPCFGLQLKSTDDIVLWSVTTDMMDLRVAPAAAGQVREYRWKLRITFGAGSYVLAVGAGTIASQGYVRHSRIHFAGQIDVLAPRRQGDGWLHPMVEFLDPGSIDSPTLRREGGFG
jgi:lipopolysaccharide transport system ATP-binding protein